MGRLVSTLVWLESALAVAGLGLLVLRAYVQSLAWHQLVYPTGKDTALGVLAMAIMLTIGTAASWASERWVSWGFLKRWMMQVYPVFAQVRPAQMVLLSVVAGIGEEALFRGVLQPIVGVWFASLLFAVVHVLRWDSDGIKMIAFYLSFGLLLGWLYALTQNLWGCMVAHTLYDIIALWWIREKR
ncbi:MAG: lysostaphin resistance A-like protein [Armatimonadota bacterium]